MTRPSHATIAAYLALFVALGGVSWAAVTLPRNSVGAKQLRKGAVRSPEIRNGAVKRRDLSFSLGRGPTGPGGAGVSFARINGVPAGGTVRYGPVSGIAPASADAFPVAHTSPAQALFAHDLHVRLSGRLPSGAVAVRLRVNDAASDLTCTVEAGGSSCTDAGAPVTIPAGATLVFAVAPDGTDAPADVLVSWRATAP